MKVRQACISLRAYEYRPSVCLGEKQERAFQKLKDFLCAAPVLALPDLNKPVTLNHRHCTFTVLETVLGTGDPRARLPVVAP
eukprot:1160976-Pelagomonas_calceolata.AAC.5